MSHGLIKGTLVIGVEGDELDKGNFVNDSFFTILQRKKLQIIIQIIYQCCVTLSSKMQMAKTNAFILSRNMPSICCRANNWPGSSFPNLLNSCESPLHSMALPWRYEKQSLLGVNACHSYKGQSRRLTSGSLSIRPLILSSIFAKKSWVSCIFTILFVRSSWFELLSSCKNFEIFFIG